MHQLENEVHLENSIKQSSNYINEDPASQNAYNDALQKRRISLMQYLIKL